MHDVAVIGAGLAGLQCARLLAARGLRVVLIDRKETLAAPIHTTGIFVRKTWEDFPLPDEQLGTPIRDVHLYSPSLRSLHLRADHDEFRVGRMEWIYLHLLEQCSRAGVQWLPSSRLIGCHDTTLTLQRGSRTETLTARYIVGADGARSSVARALGLDRNRELLVGLEDIVETTPRPAALHCFLDPRLAPGYIGWIVNDGGAAHIGIAGYGDRFEPSGALAAFRKRVAHLANGRNIERRGGFIPVNGILRRIANRRGLLVGDAAGAVSPLTAGGLDGAMRLSTFAAEVIAEYLDRGDERILSAYSGERFQARFLARRWMRRALRACEHPLLMELAFTLLQTPPLRAIASQVFFSRWSFPDIRWSGGLQAAVRQAEACRSTTQPVR
ncbi:MAG: FAD-binding monooxygenase [Acidobacteria bacterium]|nr:MAG: FAD-binding monooxygenase [Acidobacteriota bacterium]